MRPSGAVDCGRCRGLGWQHAGARGVTWPEHCAECGGAGFIRRGALARLLGVDRRDLWQVDVMRAGRRTGERVLSALARAFPDLVPAYDRTLEPGDPFLEGVIRRDTERLIGALRKMG